MKTASLLQTLITVSARVYPMAKRWLHHFHGGVFPQYNKELSAKQPVKTLSIPPVLTLPLQQHIGISTEPLVNVGDLVLKNQKIADIEHAEKTLSAPVHAPTSGRIIAIEERILPHASGLKGQCIILETDGQDKAVENALQVDGHWPNSAEQLKTLIYQAGIVGMGGAGFPTFAKLPNQKGQVHTLLINGAECEPFITCDDHLMQTDADAIIKGAQIVAQALGSTRIMAGIENNKPLAIQAMQTASKDTDIQIKPVPTVYPMGGQKQLTFELTGIETPPGAHAAETGILMMNVATFRSIYHAVTHGTPLTNRMTTITGLGFKSPYNANVMIGTPFEFLAQQALPKNKIDYPLQMGGPMMGFKVQDNQVPIIKTTNCVLNNPPEPQETVMPCIRCGECAEACPVNLLPQQLYWHSRAHDYDKVEAHNLFDCIECGCCSFVCPSHIPLVQYYRHAKTQIKERKIEAQAADLAKQRHEARLERIERIKAEKAARIKAKKAAVKQAALDKALVDPAAADEANNGSALNKKSPAAAAAAARSAAARKAKLKKQKTSSSKTSETASQTATENSAETTAPKRSARDKAIAAAQARKAAQKPLPAHPENKAASSENGTSDTKAAKRKAAMAAAKRKAQNKLSEAPLSEPTATETNSNTQLLETAPSEQSIKEAKRKAAKVAAMKRAAALKKKQASTEKKANTP